MGGRGSMSRTGGEMPERKGINATVTDEKQASGSILRDYIAAKIGSVVNYPGLKGQIYNELHSVTQGKISGNVIGLYSPGQKKITIDTRLSSAQQKATVAHELGHALASKPKKGYKTDVQAVSGAIKEYQKTHPRSTPKSFAATISNYATTSYGETFAEAFSDVATHGTKAKSTSKLVIKHWKN